MLFRSLATALVRPESAVALLADKESGHLVFAQNSRAGSDMNALLRKIFEQFAGKGGGTKDFARGALLEAAKASVALDLAKTLL